MDVFYHLYEKLYIAVKLIWINQKTSLVLLAGLRRYGLKINNDEKADKVTRNDSIKNSTFYYICVTGCILHPAINTLGGGGEGKGGGSYIKVMGMLVGKLKFNP